MRLLDSLRFRLAALFRRSQLNADMEEELRSHIQHRADDLERSGVPRNEAEHRARVEFGGYQNVREECNEAAGGTLVESIWKDFRFALRILRKSPGFTFVAVGTLALAIGANAVVFAALNAVILRPLDVPRPESLYLFQHVSDYSANQSVSRLYRPPRSQPQLRRPRCLDSHPGWTGYGRQPYPRLAL